MAEHDDASPLPAAAMRASTATRPAIREKDRGIWQTYTWREYHDHVRDLALGLAALGFRRGDKLSVIGDNRPRLYWAQVAARRLGGVSVPVYQDSIAKELAFVRNHAEVSVIVAEDQEQVDKVLALRDQLPALQPRRLRRLARHERYRTTGSSPRRGGGVGPASSAPSIPASSRPRSSRGGRRTSPSSPTPPARPAVPRARCSRTPTLVGRRELMQAPRRPRRGHSLAYLPMAWVGDSVYTLFAEPDGRLLRQLPREPGDGAARPARAGPPDAPGPAPDLGEHAHRGPGARRRRPAAQAPDVRATSARRPSAPRSCAPRASPCRLGLRLATRARRVLRLRSGPRPARPAARALGATPAARPLGPDTFRFFRSIGVNLKQVYGSTETTGLVSLQPDAEANPTTAGPAGARASRCKIAERGEVLVHERRRLQGLLQERGGHPRGDRPRRLVPHRRRRLHRSARAPGHHRPRQGRGRARRRHRRSRPSSSRTSSSSAPTSARRWPSATSGPFVAAMIAIDLGTVGNWAERRGSPTPRYMDLSPEAGGARADPRRDRRRQRDAARRDRGPALPAAHQGPRGRRRGDDAHPQGAAPLRGREVRARSSTRFYGGPATRSS